jgi:hypothetical protein
VVEEVAAATARAQAAAGRAHDAAWALSVSARLASSLHEISPADEDVDGGAPDR